MSYINEERGRIVVIRVMYELVMDSWGELDVEECLFLSEGLVIVVGFLKIWIRFILVIFILSNKRRIVCKKIKVLMIWVGIKIFWMDME